MLKKKTLDFCIKENEIDLAYLCFDCFTYLAETKTTVLDPHLSALITYCASEHVFNYIF